MPVPLKRSRTSAKPLNTNQRHLNNITANLYAIRNHGYRLANQPYRITRQFDDHISNAYSALNDSLYSAIDGSGRQDASRAIQHLSGAVNLIGTHLPNSVAHQEASAALNAAIQSHAALTKQEAEESSNV
jgi:hypothetical protein